MRATITTTTTTTTTSRAEASRRPLAGRAPDLLGRAAAWRLRRAGDAKLDDAGLRSDTTQLHGAAGLGAHAAAAEGNHRAVADEGDGGGGVACTRHASRGGTWPCISTYSTLLLLLLLLWLLLWLLLMMWRTLR